ncbi:MAG: cyclic nucleotide-binding domain-containing protein [Actinomycetota bacterium]|nr:cyclic nucleotide-binding domain-containing protein [Actinomycetota bacterium]
MADMLAATAGHPDVMFDTGDVVMTEGGFDGAIWVLVSGALNVRKGDVTVNVVTQPGAMLGEVSVLLGIGHSATVEATEPSVLRRIADGDALLSREPDAIREVAVGLAQRLNFLTTYLADLTHQYGDAPGLTMVATVLRQLEQRSGTAASPGSSRDPDPEY